MNTDKKNQHYIPKFYLRNFSYQENKKQIGVYNLNNEVYVQQAKLKSQGSKNFFYGTDGKIEDNLASIENHLASIIRNVISTKNIPRYGTDKHIDLLLFVILTDVRNPIRIDRMKSIFDEMRKRVLEVDSKADVENIVPNLSRDELIKMLFGDVMENVKIILDLGYKILVNKPLLLLLLPTIQS